jgi:hypothetical protein
VADEGDAERYEQLRRSALAGDPIGCRLGLAVLERRGVAAWMRAWRTTTPGPRKPLVPLGIPLGGDELVGVLTAMALACLDAR